MRCFYPEIIIRYYDDNNNNKHINTISGNLSLYEIEKTALCGTALLLKRLLSMYLKNITQKRQQKKLNT